MKYNFILHARNKMGIYNGPNGDMLYKKKGIVFRPLKIDERDNYVIGGKGGVTVRVIKEDNTLIWSVAKCNTTDMYNKRKGINQALENSNINNIVTSNMAFDNVINISKRLAIKVNKHGYQAIKHIHNEAELIALK